ncbi:MULTISPECIES: hypothetical protein [Nocardiopsis]|uniref:hypothetical protein n=1 Tax=Nocardiopsis TaxID=2013 RepID=UPI00117FB6F0|nr:MULTISPECIES: hypothetical protein [Nocardiopsis]
MDKREIRITGSTREQKIRAFPKDRENAILTKTDCNKKPRTKAIKETVITSVVAPQLKAKDAGSAAYNRAAKVADAAMGADREFWPTEDLLLLARENAITPTVVHRKTNIK